MKPEAERADFVKWKFRLQLGLLWDDKLEPNAVRVGLCLLNHANPDTKAIFPSQEALGDEVNMSPRQVRKLIARLLDVGWLMVHRDSRHAPNRYQFLDGNVQRVLRHQDEKRGQRARRRMLATGTNDPVSDSLPDAPTGTDVPLQTGTNDPLNTKREEPKDKARRAA